MVFVYGNKYIGSKGKFTIELLPGTLARYYGKRQYKHLEIWYACMCSDGVYTRWPRPIKSPGITSLLLKKGFKVDDLIWEHQPSIIHVGLPWKHLFSGIEKCIYFIRALGTDRVKIGWATDLNDRYGILSCSSPYPLEIICSVPGSRRDEAKLHRKFSHLRLHNEWFLYSDEIKEFVETIKIGENK